MNWHDYYKVYVGLGLELNVSLNVVSLFFGLSLALSRHFDSSSVLWLRVLTGFASSIAIFSSKQRLHLLEPF